MRKLLLLLIVLLPLAGLQARRAASGVRGQIVFLKGDFMPGPEPAHGTTRPVSRKIFFYEPVSLDQAGSEGVGGFYSKLSTPLVAQTQSGPDGSFSLPLRPATYTMVVEENGKLYANGSDGHFLYPVVVKPGKFTEVRFQINYQSTW